jgi:hypothetical protein
LSVRIYCNLGRAEDKLIRNTKGNIQNTWLAGKHRPWLVRTGVAISCPASAGNTTSS